jgi:hypothetical protein
MLIVQYRINPMELPIEKGIGWQAIIEKSGEKSRTDQHE